MNAIVPPRPLARETHVKPPQKSDSLAASSPLPTPALAAPSPGLDVPLASRRGPLSQPPPMPSLASTAVVLRCEPSCKSQRV